MLQISNLLLTAVMHTHWTDPATPSPAQHGLQPHPAQPACLPACLRSAGYYVISSPDCAASAGGPVPAHFGSHEAQQHAGPVARLPAGGAAERRRRLQDRHQRHPRRAQGPPKRELLAALEAAGAPHLSAGVTYHYASPCSQLPDPWASCLVCIQHSVKTSITACDGNICRSSLCNMR